MNGDPFLAGLLVSLVGSLVLSNAVQVWLMVRKYYDTRALAVLKAQPEKKVKRKEHAKQVYDPHIVFKNAFNVHLDSKPAMYQPNQPEESLDPVCLAWTRRACDLLRARAVELDFACWDDKKLCSIKPVQSDVDKVSILASMLKPGWEETIFAETDEEIKDMFHCGIGKAHIVILRDVLLAGGDVPPYLKHAMRRYNKVQEMEASKE